MRDSTLIKAFDGIEKTLDKHESTLRYLTSALVLSGVIQTVENEKGEAQPQFVEPGAFTALTELRTRGLFGRVKWLFFGK